MENKTAKHTPGPWRVGGGDGNLIFAPDGCVIAQADACDAKHFKEDTPNARLIAAAPELLACLKLALEEGDFLPSIKEAFEKTIAKAEGR